MRHTNRRPTLRPQSRQDNQATGVANGYNPSGGKGAFVSRTSEEHEFWITQTAVAVAANVSAVTVRGREEKLEAALSE